MVKRSKSQAFRDVKASQENRRNRSNWSIRSSFSDVSRGKRGLRISTRLTPKLKIESIARIEDLICGLPIVGGPYVDRDHSGLVDRLRVDLAELHPQIQIVVGKKSGLPASSVFPFLARKFLELAFTSLLARLDPLRVIAARKNQTDTSFEPGRQNAASVSWTGDILPSKRILNGNPWNSVNLEKGVERSVLGWHFGEVAIAPGLNWLADTESSNSEWLRKLSAQENPFEWIKGHLGRLYSCLSKGVHAEYLLDDRTAFDQASVQQYMEDCYMFVLLLATATHISPLFARSLPTESAIFIFRELERQIVGKENS